MQKHENVLDCLCPYCDTVLIPEGMERDKITFYCLGCDSFVTESKTMQHTPAMI